MDYVLHILIVIGIYVMLSTSLNLIAGYSGQLSVAHAAFYGVGAYVAVLLAVELHTPFLFNAACAIKPPSHAAISGSRRVKRAFRNVPVQIITAGKIQSPAPVMFSVN